MKRGPAVALLAGCLGACAPAGGAVDWPATGRDLQGTRYLPASAITPDSVRRLEPAWTYDTGDTGPRFDTFSATPFQSTPILLNGTLYTPTPSGRVVALDPATGRERWVFERPRGSSRRTGRPRGVAIWIDPAAAAGATCRHRVFFVSTDPRLYALDADTGDACAGFGRNGMVNLRRGLRIQPTRPGAYSAASAPLAVNGLVIVGAAIEDDVGPAPASGEVRAFDARTGTLVWTWDPIPQDPADPARDEWLGAVGPAGGAANAWAGFAADPDRDLVFVPTSSPAPDNYGGLRLGDNRYANSIVALRLSTGERVWSFQTVHHDLWDYDNPAPPALVSIRRDGVDVPAVLVATKTGMLFVLHRETGVPLFPVEERPVPASDVPGEVAAPTQPFTTTTPQLGLPRLTPEDAWGLTEADRVVCQDTIAALRHTGTFTPPSEQGTVVTPSVLGGAHWGGLAVDPARQVAVVPVNRIASMVQLIPRAAFDRAQFLAEDARKGVSSQFADVADTPYVVRRRFLMGPSGLPCSPPPWGTLVAVDLTSGRVLWEVPLGRFTRPFAPEVAAGISDTWGSPNLGGPIVTAGGVVFIGAAYDRALHAYDIETGRELWRGPLAESGRATPMGYQLPNGDQYVVIAVSGHAAAGTTHHLAAFRLPAGARGAVDAAGP